MKKTIVFGFVFLLLFGFFAGMCSAEQSPSLTAHIQGGESSITNGTEGAMVITVKDVDPNVNVTNGSESIEKPVDFLIDVAYPFAAALELSNGENDSVSMVNIEKITISDDNKTLTLQATPLQYYEGISLQEFAKKSVTFDQQYNKTFNETRIHGEIIEESPTNIK